MVEVAGFVLAGGLSSRMGRDKALLEVEGLPLVQRIAVQVNAAAGSCTIIGHLDPYAHLGYPVVPDRLPGLGPIGGIVTALSLELANWNLIVACDMPLVDGEFLKTLIQAAQASNADVLLPVSGADQPEPLCAVYRKECGPHLAAELDSGVRKVRQALCGLQVSRWEVPDNHWFTNLNTVQDWERLYRA